MHISLEQKEYYRKKLLITIIKYSKLEEYKFDETVSDCFRYLETNKDDEFKNINERKKIFSSVLSTCTPEIQCFYFNLKRNPNKDFYGVNKVIENIIENYDEQMIKDLLTKHNPNINLDNFKVLNELSNSILANVNLLSVHKIFNNYTLPKDYLKHLSSDLGNNIKKILSNEINDLSFLKEDISGMKKFLTLLNEKEKITEINKKISRNLSSKDKKSSNKVENMIDKLEATITENNSVKPNINPQQFFNLYISNLNNLKLDVLNLLYKLDEDKKSKLNTDIEYLKEPIDNYFFENKIFNFLKNKIEKIKYGKKITYL